MPTVKYRPITPSRRFITTLDFSDLSNEKPLRSLVEKKKRSGGRNNRGRITSRYIGGGHKRRYRVIDFNRRDKEGVPGKIASIEYDPNRSANIARLHYRDGEKRYVLAPHGAKVGDTLVSGKDADIRNGNAMCMEYMPLGTLVHNVELKIGRGGKMARSAGSYAQIMAREAGYVQLRVPSGEIRRVRQECYATIGQVSNVDHENVTIGKAGRTRWLGRRGHVRGSAMNPVDHPHGGGEGKTTGGRHPVTPWGVSAKGKKTRKNKRTNDLIVQRRKHRKKK